MRRRDVIRFLGGAIVLPATARAQQAALPVVGHLDLGALEGRQSYLAALAGGLAELGFLEGRNVAIEYRSAAQDPDRLPVIAADLVRKRVSVIVTTGGNASAKAAQAATATIPVVFETGGDPVGIGLVASLNRPGGNVTGITILTNEIAGKRLDLMHDLAPAAATIAYLDAPFVQDPPESLLAAAAALGRNVVVVRAADEADLSGAFAMAIERQAQAMILAPRPLFNSKANKIAALAAQHRIPVISYERSFPDAGGLISYGTSLPEAYRIAGTYAGRILQGEKPADLPVQRSTKVELIINLKTAKTLGLSIPPSLLALADEVIE